MTKEDIIRKLTSRKFWAAVAEFVTMLIIALNGSRETATQVAALIMAGAAVIAYIVGEGLADAAGAGAQVISLPVNWEEEDQPPEVDEAMDKADEDF